VGAYGGSGVTTASGGTSVRHDSAAAAGESEREGNEAREEAGARARRLESERAGATGGRVARGVRPRGGRLLPRSPRARASGRRQARTRVGPA
jgi:hypothetical protein